MDNTFKTKVTDTVDETCAMKQKNNYDKRHPRSIFFDLNRKITALDIK